MATLASLFAGGRAIDIILALVAIEAVALLLWRLRRGDGPSTAALLCNLASGAALMLAVREALVDAHWAIVALCLLGALVAHLADLALRFRAHPTEPASVSLGRTRNYPARGTSKEPTALHARP